MTESKHTPGPWNVCGEGKCSCKTVSCADFPIAKVTAGEWGDTFPSIRLVGDSSLDMKAEPYIEQISYGTVDNETATANARLIAAAPDLLEVLQVILHPDYEAIVYFVPSDASAMELRDRARSAIAKATGKSIQG